MDIVVIEILAVIAGAAAAGTFAAMGVWSVLSVIWPRKDRE